MGLGREEKFERLFKGRGSKAYSYLIKFLQLSRFFSRNFLVLLSYIFSFRPNRAKSSFLWKTPFKAIFPSSDMFETKKIFGRRGEKNKNISSKNLDKVIKISRKRSLAFAQQYLFAVTIFSRVRHVR